MLPGSLLDEKLFQTILEIDRQTAEECRRGGCPCGGKLHRADYPRKPRGYDLGPLEEDYSRRFSFCCDRDGCRKRSTPPSLRFLGRHVYLAAVVLWAAVLWVKETRLLDNVPKRALNRWLCLWQQDLPRSKTWHRKRGLLPPILDIQSLPASLLLLFEGPFFDKLLACLRFIQPFS